MTPVVPFDPARATGDHIRVSLQAAYSDAMIRSFVEKLRELAAVSPNTCAARFGALDTALATMLADATRPAKLNHVTCESADYALVDVQRQKLAKLLQKFATVRPAVLVVIEQILTDLGS